MSNSIGVASPTVAGPRAYDLFLKAQLEQVPLTGGLELTHRCNLACIHCYVNLAPNDREAQQREMTTAEVCNVIDQMVDAGTLYLTLTGGEPLLRPDFAEIYTHAHERGLVLTVYTNATLVTDRIVDLWVARPPRLLEITQYGYTRETYDRVTDMGAQFDRFERGLGRVRAAGIHVTLKAIAMRATRDELHQIRARAHRDGMRFRFDAILSPRIDGGRKPLEQRLSPAEVAAIEADDHERQAEFADYCRDHRGFVQPSDRRYHCGAGLSTFLIDPYGKLHLCELSRRPGWDVLRDGLAAGFKSQFPKLRAEKRTHKEGCGSCPTIISCSNCAGMSELEGRSSDDGDPDYMCRVTDARQALVFGAERPSPNGLVQLRRKAR
jgi:radical SAM protein with 4Fe4S-binding SPASM domain